MAASIYFRKDLAERLVDCLANGKPIEDIRTVNDMLALAGACFFVALSHGPMLPKSEDPGTMSEEHREALNEELFSDFHDAIEFYGMLTQRVVDNDYDADFAPIVRAAVGRENGEKVLVPVQGFRKEKNLSDEGEV